MNNKEQISSENQTPTKEDNLSTSSESLNNNGNKSEKLGNSQSSMTKIETKASTTQSAPKRPSPFEKYRQNKELQMKSLKAVESEIQKNHIEMEALTREFDKAQKSSRDFKADQNTREKHSKQAELLGPKINQISHHIRELEVIKKTQEIKMRSAIPILGPQFSKPSAKPKSLPQTKSIPEQNSKFYLEQLKELTKLHAEEQLRNTNLQLASSTNQKEQNESEEKLEELKEKILKAKENHRNAVACEFKPEEWTSHLRQICLGQTVIKSFLAVKRFKVLKRKNSLRLKVAQEILFTEVKYQQNLREISEVSTT